MIRVEFAATEGGCCREHKRTGHHSKRIQRSRQGDEGNVPFVFGNLGDKAVKGDEDSWRRRTAKDDAVIDIEILSYSDDLLDLPRRVHWTKTVHFRNVRLPDYESSVANVGLTVVPTHGRKVVTKKGQVVHWIPDN